MRSPLGDNVDMWNHIKFILIHPIIIASSSFIGDLVSNIRKYSVRVHSGEDPLIGMYLVKRELSLYLSTNRFLQKYSS